MTKPVELVYAPPRLHRHISQWTSRAQRDAWRAERMEAVLGPRKRSLEAAGIPYTVRIVSASPPPLLERIALPAGFLALLMLVDEA